jgi:hypothetical protein
VERGGREVEEGMAQVCAHCVGVLVVHVLRIVTVMAVVMMAVIIMHMKFVGTEGVGTVRRSQHIARQGPASRPLPTPTRPTDVLLRSQASRGQALKWPSLLRAKCENVWRRERHALGRIPSSSSSSAHPIYCSFTFTNAHTATLSACASASMGRR